MGQQNGAAPRPAPHPHRRPSATGGPGPENRGQGRGQGRGWPSRARKSSGENRRYRGGSRPRSAARLRSGASAVIRGCGVAGRLAFAGAAIVLFALASGRSSSAGWPSWSVCSREAGQTPAGDDDADRHRDQRRLFSTPSPSPSAWRGEVLYWELATLIDVMLLGHWIELRSGLGASGALEKLVRLMPDTAQPVL